MSTSAYRTKHSEHTGKPSSVHFIEEAAKNRKAHDINELRESKIHEARSPEEIASWIQLEEVDFENLSYAEQFQLRAPLWLAYRDQCYTREEEIKLENPGLYRAMRGSTLVGSEMNVLSAIESDTREAFDRWFSAAINESQQLSIQDAIGAAEADIDAWIERTDVAASNEEEI